MGHTVVCLSFLRKIYRSNTSQLLLEWLRGVLFLRGLHRLSPLVVPAIMEPVPDQDLFSHRHKLLVYDLPGLDTSLSRNQGYLIFENNGQVVVELHSDHKEKADLHWQQNHKRAKEFFDIAPVHIISLN